MAPNKHRRRNLFEDENWLNKNFVPTFENLPSNSPVNSPISKIPEPPSTIDMIAPVKQKAVRKRTWDKAHPAKRFRRVDPDLVTQVNKIARDQNLPSSSIAQVFLEFGFESYQNGMVSVDIDFENSRRTLHPLPENNQRAWRYIPGGSGSGLAEPKRNKKEKSESKKRDWEFGATWRISEDLELNIKNLANSLRVPVGDIITLLCKFSLGKYENGELLINTNRFFPTRTATNRNKSK